MKHIVTMQIRGPLEKNLIDLLNENKFHIYVVDKQTGEYQSLNKSWEEIPEHCYLECIYNNNEIFPPQEVLEKISKQEGLIYLSIKYGDKR